MPLDVIHGEVRHRALASRLADVLTDLASTGTLYLGYPVLPSAAEPVAADALMVSSDKGLVAFLIREDSPSADGWAEITGEQDRLYAVLEGYLGRHDPLRRGRHLAVEIHTITVFPVDVQAPVSAAGAYVGFEQLPGIFAGLKPLDPEIVRPLSAALERVASIRPSKRRARVKREDSRGAILKHLERQIANLDRFQKQAAIESPDGPQRIRGLAGSGKTVVLALKAAYWHSQHPDWRIGVTFFSRALYQQFQQLTTRFSFESSGDAPDFETLQIMHSWGGSGQTGVYRTLAHALGATPRDWGYASSTWGRSNAFRGACAELLEIARASEVAPIFDAFLIDEAQDLPPEFFQLVYMFSKDPKRIVWAYDELQNLSESIMPATDELFGVTPSGDPVVTVENSEGEARRDVVLPICYRNPPWTLAAAHAIGFGIYREGGLVQHFDNLKLWTEIGYTRVAGSLRDGRNVVLERSPDSYPDFMKDLLNPKDSLVIAPFARQTEQDEWVAAQIAKNLGEDELDYDDIVIVVPEARTAKSRASRVGKALARHNIASHLVGFSSNADEFWLNESISISHIFRAKGNEAPMVYALDAQEAVPNAAAITRRNTLFTAMTRSRAWVRVCGWGPDMPKLVAEFETVRQKRYQLDFRVPNAAERATLRRIHRERSAEETAAVRRSTEELARLVEALDRGEMQIEDVPASLRRRLREALSGHDSEDDDV